MLGKRPVAVGRGWGRGEQAPSLPARVKILLVEELHPALLSKCCT